MHAWEIEQLAVSLYERLGYDPLHPPGITRLAARHWGVTGTIRYEPRPAPFRVGSDGWELTLPPGAHATEMNVALAEALAGALAPTLDAQSRYRLAGALILPLPAARRDVHVYGRDAATIARAYHLPATVAEYRQQQVLDHGSGERPSAQERVAKRSEG